MPPAKRRQITPGSPDNKSNALGKNPPREMFEDLRREPPLRRSLKKKKGVKKVGKIKNAPNFPWGKGMGNPKPTNQGNQPPWKGAKKKESLGSKNWVPKKPLNLGFEPLPRFKPK